MSAVGVLAEGGFGKELEGGGCLGVGVDDELVVVLVQLSCGCVGAGWYDWGFAVSEIYEAGGYSWVDVIFQYRYSCSRGTVDRGRPECHGYF